MYIIVVGAGKVGYYLTRELLAKGHEVSLIEKDKSRYNELVSKLIEKDKSQYNELTNKWIDKLNIILGDGSQVETLKGLGISRADVVVALTEDDEDNLVICQVAKQLFWANQTIARVSDPTNEQTFKNLGVDRTISSTKMILNLIEHEVGSAAIITLLTIEENKTIIVKVKLKEDSPIINKKIMDIPLPKQCAFISIIRKENIIIPRGDTILKNGDNLLILTNPSVSDELKDKILGVK